MTAASGSASDIQAAVDYIVSHGGVGTVHIPAGTFDFVPAGTWYENADNLGFVMIPAGVNIVGAAPVVDGSGQVVDWTTTLRCPTQLTSSPPNNIGAAWFFFYGSGDSGLTTRFANIEIIGERVFNYYTDVLASRAIIFEEVMDYRVDHCNFEDIASGAIFAGWYGNQYLSYVDTHCCGVIDHNRFVNNGYALPQPFGVDGFVMYAIQLGRGHNTYWDDNVANVFGHYTSYTTFIEDNYFSQWRHSVASNDGYHYVFRYNTVDGSWGFGDIDAHGTYNRVGTRAVEAYGNTFKNCQNGFNHQAFFHRGGAAIVTGNTNDGSYYTVSGMGFDQLEPAKCLVNDTYIWGNGDNWGFSADSMYQENVNYFLRAPNMADDGFEWTPYTYPHPLTH